MAKIKKLQLHQFEINKSNIINKEIYIYKWPSNLAGYLKDRQNGFQLNPSITNLSEAINLTFDEVIYSRNRINNSIVTPEDEYWIFTLNNLNEEILKSIIIEWLLANKISDLKYDDIDIEKPIAASATDLFDDAYKFDVYNIIPKLYCYEFCEKSVEIPSIERSVNFYPVIGSERDSVVISNTLNCEDSREKVERFSYAVTFRLAKNYEFPNKYFLNIYTGVKIWQCRALIDIEKNDNYITSKNATSFYVYKENDYRYNNLKKFAKLKFNRDKYEFFTYKDYSDRVLSKQLSLDLLSVLKDPNRYNDFSTEDNDLVFLITNNNRTEFVKYGAGLPERTEIFNSIQARFPELKYRERITELKSGRSLTIEKKDTISKISRFNDEQDNLEYLDIDADKFFNTSPPVFLPEKEKVVIEIYSDNKDLKKATLEFVIRVLSLNMPLGDLTYKSPDGYEVAFVMKSGDIARGLSAKEKSNNLRTKEVSDLCKKDTYKTAHILSLIDIEAFHINKETKEQDPKITLRNAFKYNGRITQFINNFDGEEKVDRIRLINSIYDLFSAAGFMDYNYVNFGFAEKVLLGLSSIKGSNGRLIALSKIENAKVLYKIYKLSDDRWYDINEIIPSLTYYKLNSILKANIDKKHFDNWIVEQLNSIKSEKECYFYFDAVLREKFWDFAKNGRMNTSNLRLLRQEKFKFIRVNTTGEVPEYNIYKNDFDEEGINKCQGLFPGINGVFYSVGARPDSMKGIRNDATKVTSAKKMIGKQKITEFVVLGEENEEEAILLANQSHALRKFNLTFDASTKYPLPIYLNDRFGEYLEI